MADKPGILYELCGPLGAIAAPLVLTQEGGEELRLQGVWPAGQGLEVFVGPAGSTADAPAYGGEGFGYSPLSADGVFLSFVTPPLSAGRTSLPRGSIETSSPTTLAVNSGSRGSMGSSQTSPSPS